MSFDGAGTSGAGAVTEAAVEAARMLLGQIPGLSKEKLEERAQQIAEEYGEPTIDELKDDILNALLGQDQVEEFSNKLKMSRHEKRKLSDWLKANGKSGAVLQSNATQVEVEAARMLLVRIPWSIRKIARGTSPTYRNRVRSADRRRVERFCSGRSVCPSSD